MSLNLLNQALETELDTLATEGRSKAPERVIDGVVAPEGLWGPRYRLRGSDQLYIRMNANSYLSLSMHPAVIAAADEATHRFGAGPGAVRFIDGTFEAHIQLEDEIAAFVGRPAARSFNSAYTTNLGVALALHTKRTYWIGDALNHNCIIRAMRIAGVPSAQRTIYKHNDMASLKTAIEGVPEGIDRVIVIFDGVFSMRGDHAPIDQINAVLAPHRGRFAEGLITVVDDSHGVGAFGATGRGTEEVVGAQADVYVGTFGKAFGVNGGFVASSPQVVEAVRQKADTTIYTNPLGVPDCAAALAAVKVAASADGQARLVHLHARVKQLRDGIAALGLETIPGLHPVVPLMVRETEKTRTLVRRFFENGVLVVGLNFPVVPQGDQTIRFQVNAAHTEADIAEVLRVLAAIQ